MRGKFSAGVLMALVLLVPAAPAMAQTGPPVPSGACKPVDRKVYKDIRRLVTIDPDTATDVQVRILANQILAEAVAESLPVLPRAVQERLDGTTADLRTFLKTGVLKAWSTDLEISTVRTLTGAGANVRAAAQKVLDDGDTDAYLAYLNDGLYAARALDCASQPTPSQPTASQPTASQPTPSRPTGSSSVTPSATTTATAIPSSSAGGGTAGGEGGGLPVTGAAAGTVVGIGGALLLMGGAAYLIARRRRSRFVA